MAKIEPWECCPDRSLIEYWHEHRNCGDPMCYAEECEYCGNWETLCGMSSSNA